jgi:hypothetical protein
MIILLFCTKKESRKRLSFGISSGSSATLCLIIKFSLNHYFAHKSLILRFIQTLFITFGLSSIKEVMVFIKKNT